MYKLLLYSILLLCVSVSVNASSSCIRDVRSVIDLTYPNASLMIQYSGKDIPNDLGDFDGCLRLRLHARYCTVDGDDNDIKLRLGLCVPYSCHSGDMPDVITELSTVVPVIGQLYHTGFCADELSSPPRTSMFVMAGLCIIALLVIIISCAGPGWNDISSAPIGRTTMTSIAYTPVSINGNDDDNVVNVGTSILNAFSIVRNTKKLSYPSRLPFLGTSVVLLCITGRWHKNNQHVLDHSRAYRSICLADDRCQ